MLAQFYAPIVGGEERMTQSLATALVERGHEVAVATLQHPGLAGTEELDGVRIHRLPGLAARSSRLYSDGGRRHAPPAPDPETVLALRRVLRRERPDVVHGHNWLAHAYLPLHRRDPAAYVLSLHDYSLVCSTKRLMYRDRPCSGPGMRKCAECARGTIRGDRPGHRAGDLALRALAAARRRPPAPGQRGGRARLRARGIRRALRGDPELPLAGGRARRRAASAELPDGPFVLFVGDVSIDKGVGVLAEAHARLQTRIPLVLMGRTVDAGLVPSRDDVVDLGLQPYPAVLAAMRRCTAAVVPSIWPDSFPTVALEAMAAGAPVVVSRIGGLPEQVVDGESGLVVAAGDAGELCGALERLLGDAELRERLGAGARARVEMFTAPAVVPRYESAYERVVAARSAKLGGR